MKKTVGLVVLVVFLVLTGCGGGDDNNIGPGVTDDFDQVTAITATIHALDAAMEMTMEFPQFALDTPGPCERDGTWDGEAWHWTETFSLHGTTLEFEYYLQYRGAEGNPLQCPGDAVSMHIEYTGTIESAYSEGGNDCNQLYSYDFGMNYAGLQTDTLNMDGAGDWTLDYNCTGTEGSYDFYYEMSWQTGTDGIDIPLGNGCPSGIMVWDLPPLELIIELNQPAGYATATLYDDMGLAIWSDAEFMDCD